MDDLMHVKQVIAQTVSDLQKDQEEGRQPIKVALAGLFNLGVVAFDEAFSSFVGKVGQNQDMFDRWLNIQMQVWTDLGPRRDDLIREFSTMFDKVMKGTEGGAAFVVHPQAGQFSYTCALMFRVYTDALVLQAPQEEGGGKQ